MECRERKAKCVGEDVCQRCQGLGMPCIQQQRPQGRQKASSHLTTMAVMDQLVQKCIKDQVNMEHLRKELNNLATRTKIVGKDCSYGAERMICRRLHIKPNEEVGASNHSWSVQQPLPETHIIWTPTASAVVWEVMGQAYVDMDARFQEFLSINRALEVLRTAKDPVMMVWMEMLPREDDRVRFYDTLTTMLVTGQEVSYTHLSMGAVCIDRRWLNDSVVVTRVHGHGHPSVVSCHRNWKPRLLKFPSISPRPDAPKVSEEHEAYIRKCRFYCLGPGESEAATP